MRSILLQRFLCYPPISVCARAYVCVCTYMAMRLWRLCVLQIDFVATAPVAITIAIAFRLRQKYCNYA